MTHAAQPAIQRLSALCTSPPEATVAGKHAIITATSESVTVRNAFQTKRAVTPISENTAEGFRVQGGLSFLDVQQDGTQASAGRRESLALLTSW